MNEFKVTERKLHITEVVEALKDGRVSLREYAQDDRNVRDRDCSEYTANRIDRVQRRTVRSVIRREAERGRAVAQIFRDADRNTSSDMS